MRKRKKCKYCNTINHNLTRDSCHDCWTVEQMLFNKTDLVCEIIRQNDDLQITFDEYLGYGEYDS